MNRIVETALKYEGYPAVRYRTPDIGNNPEGFDCSGFFQWVLIESEISVPTVPGTSRTLRHSEEFFDFFGLLIHEPARQPGDIIFFSRNGYRPTHLGIYLSEEKMVHSPGIDGTTVCIRPIDDLCREKYLKYNPARGFPQIYFRNPIGYKRPALHSGKRYQTVL